MPPRAGWLTARQALMFPPYDFHKMDENQLVLVWVSSLTSRVFPHICFSAFLPTLSATNSLNCCLRIFALLLPVQGDTWCSLIPRRVSIGWGG